MNAYEELSPVVKRMRELVSLGYVYDHLKAGVVSSGAIPVAVYKHRESGETREVINVPLDRLPQGLKDWSALLSEESPREQRAKKPVRVIERKFSKTERKREKEAEGRRAEREAEERREARMSPEEREKERQARAARIASDQAKKDAHKAKKTR